MSTLADLLAEHTTLTDAAAGHLQRLVAEWQLLADLSFADFTLTVRGADGALVTVAQCRPNTESTVFPGDEVGRIIHKCAVNDLDQRYRAVTELIADVERLEAPPIQTTA